MRRGLFLLTFLCSFLGAVTPLQPHNRVPTLNLLDQYDHTITIDKDARFLIYTAQKDVALEVANILEQKEQLLRAKKIYFLSDISDIPSFIASWFAIPKMRSYPFSILLIQQEQISDYFGATEGHVTLYSLEQSKVQKVVSLTPTQLKQFLEQL